MYRRWSRRKDGEKQPQRPNRVLALAQEYFQKRDVGADDSPGSAHHSLPGSPTPNSLILGRNMSDVGSDVTGGSAMSPRGGPARARSDQSLLVERRLHGSLERLRQQTLKEAGMAMIRGTEYGRRQPRVHRAIASVHDARREMPTASSSSSTSVQQDLPQKQQSEMLASAGSNTSPESFTASGATHSARPPDGRSSPKTWRGSQHDMALVPSASEESARRESLSYNSRQALPLGSTPSLESSGRASSPQSHTGAVLHIPASGEAHVLLTPPGSSSAASQVNLPIDRTVPPPPPPATSDVPLQADELMEDTLAPGQARTNRRGIVTIDAESPTRNPGRRGLSKLRDADAASVASNMSDAGDPTMWESIASVQQKSRAAASGLHRHEYDECGFETLNGYIMGTEIGRGSYGRVYEAYTEDGARVAVKIVYWGRRLMNRSANVSQVPTRQQTPAITPTPSQHVTPDVTPHVQHLTAANFPPGNTPGAQSLSADDFDRPPSSDGGGEDQLKGVPVSILQEVYMMRRLQHKNLLGLREVINHRSARQLLLVFPYMAGGPLLNASNRGVVLSGQRSEADARTVFTQIATGVLFMHSRNCVHLDIKPGNILLDDDGNAFLSDFGTARVCTVDSSDVPAAEGTAPFLPPEAFADDSDAMEGGKPADMWALGVTLYMMLFGRHPFASRIVQSKFADVGRAICETPLQFPDAPVVSDECRDVITRLLTRNPKRRITAVRLYRHPWVKGKKQPKDVTTPDLGPQPAPRRPSLGDLGLSMDSTPGNGLDGAPSPESCVVTLPQAVLTGSNSSGGGLGAAATAPAAADSHSNRPRAHAPLSMTVPLVVDIPGSHHELGLARSDSGGDLTIASSDANLSFVDPSILSPTSAAAAGVVEEVAPPTLENLLEAVTEVKTITARHNDNNQYLGSRMALDELDDES